MQSNIKQLVKAIANGTVKYLSRSRVGGYVCELILNSAMSATQTINHDQIKLTFSTPN